MYFKYVYIYLYTYMYFKYVPVKNPFKYVPLLSTSEKYAFKYYLSPDWQFSFKYYGVATIIGLFCRALL